MKSFSESAPLHLTILLAMALIMLFPVCAHGGSHLWSLSALYFDAPAFETESFNMTEEAFSQKQELLEAREIAAYEKLAFEMQDDRLALLDTAEQDWQRLYKLYSEVLKAQLDEQVKVFYGDEHKEKKTNIYRDSIFELLSQRISDLECQALGRFGYVTENDLTDANKRANTLRAHVDDAFMCNRRAMDEPFREDAQLAQNAWRSYLASNALFISALTDNSKTIQVAEELIQLERMYELTLLHLEGSFFFHREREE